MTNCHNRMTLRIEQHHDHCSTVVSSANAAKSTSSVAESVVLSLGSRSSFAAEVAQGEMRIVGHGYCPLTTREARRSQACKVNLHYLFCRFSFHCCNTTIICRTNPMRAGKNPHVAIVYAFSTVIFPLKTSAPATRSITITIVIIIRPSHLYFVFILAIEASTDMRAIRDAIAPYGLLMSSNQKNQKRAEKRKGVSMNLPHFNGHFKRGYPNPTGVSH